MKAKKDLFVGLFFLSILSIFTIILSNISIMKNLSISPLIIAIFLGVICAHIFKKSFIEYLQTSIIFSTKQLLRLGIILYGFRLTLQNLLEVGLEGFIFSLVIVITTFILGYFIGTKILKLDKELTILTSIGSSICGAAAVLATESVLKTPAYKSTVAVSTVVIFGTLSMLLYPFLYKLSFFDLQPHNFGLYIGGTLHEVAHVVAGANAISSEVANSAVIEKMIRVILLAPFLLVLTFVRFKSSDSKYKKGKITIPWFAIIFLVIILFNSMQLIGAKNVELINYFDTFLLTIAMLALGLQTHISKFKSVGVKPFYLALILFFWLTIGGYNILKLILSFC